MKCCLSEVLHYTSSADHDVEYNTDAPDIIGTAVVRDALQHLRWCVRSTAAVSPTQLIGRLNTSETKVRQFNVVVHIQQYVLTLQISNANTSINSSNKIIGLFWCRIRNMSLWRQFIANIGGFSVISIFQHVWPTLGPLPDLFQRVAQIKGHRLPRRDGRLSWLRWMVTHRDGLSAHRRGGHPSKL